MDSDMLASSDEKGTTFTMLTLQATKEKDFAKGVLCINKGIFLKG
jgi:hypothetical protein